MMQNAITPVATGGALFVGLASRGPARRPVSCTSFADFVKQFGPSTPNSELAGSVSLFFQNGGKQCTILRLERGSPAEYQAVWKLLPAALSSSEFLVLPRVAGRGVEQRERLWGSASQVCRNTRTLFLMDPPDTWKTAADVMRGLNTLPSGLQREHIALYYPRLQATTVLGAAGAAAGVLSQQKPWPVSGNAAPPVRDVRGTVPTLTQPEIETLNRSGVNTIRQLRDGFVLWGTRTLAGAEGQPNDYRYVPVRRLANHIERSILAGTTWARTQRNDQTLWSNLQGLAENFLMELWQEQAFQGTRPQEAFLARCGTNTTSAADRARKNAIIMVGFAPIKPAEFVILRIPVRTAG